MYLRAAESVSVSSDEGGRGAKDIDDDEGGQASKKKQQTVKLVHYYM